MVRYPYAYDRWSAASSPEPYLSTPASPSPGSPNPATYNSSRPRPAEVEDFEGSDAEFAPRIVKPVVKPKKVQLNPTNGAKRVQPPPIITGMSSADAPSVFDPSPSSPSLYSAHSEYSTGSAHQRGRPPQRNSFYSINYTRDRGSDTGKSTTPVDASEPLRGILKNGKDRDDNPRPERQPSRSGSRVRFPSAQTEEPNTPCQWMRDPPGPGSLAHEDSMDSNGTTRAECNYTGHKTRHSRKSRRSRSPIPDINDPEGIYERPRMQPDYYQYGESARVPSSSPRPAARSGNSDYHRQHNHSSRPSPVATSAPYFGPFVEGDDYVYYRPPPSPKPPLQREYYPQHDQYDQYGHGQYKPYDQYERYRGYEQYSQSQQYTQYPPMDYRPGPPLAPQSPIFHSVQPAPVPAPVPVHPVHPAHAVYMDQPRPRSSSDTYLSPPTIYIDPGRPRSSSGATYLSPTTCYNTGAPPYYNPPSPGPGYPPPSFF